MKKQAQPFAAPVFWERHSQAAVISCVVGDFPVPLSTATIASLRAIMQVFRDRHGSRLLRG